MLVPLAKGRGFAVVDLQDAEEVAKFNWALLSPGYAVARIRLRNGIRTGLPLHQLIVTLMGLGRCSQIDHEDHDGLNNRRSNLRPATRYQNGQNTRRPRNNTSGVKGVSWSAAAGKWLAQVGAYNYNHRLGLFEDINDAEAAVRAARERLHGEFACHG